MFRIFVLSVALIASPVVAQAPPATPVDRLSIPDADVVSLVASQTEVLQTMSEKLSRIEEIVTDTNERTATRADVAALMEKLSDIRSNLSCPAVVSADPCASVSVPSSVLAVSPGERIVSIDGVPVNQPAPQVIQQFVPQVVQQPVGQTTVQTPFRTIVTDQGSGSTTVRAPFVRVTTNNQEANQQCYTDPTGQTVCPQSNEYNPANVTTPQNDLGRGGPIRRRGLFGGFFRRR